MSVLALVENWLTNRLRGKLRLLLKLLDFYTSQSPNTDPNMQQIGYNKKQYIIQKIINMIKLRTNFLRDSDHKNIGLARTYRGPNCVYIGPGLRV